MTNRGPARCKEKNRAFWTQPFRSFLQALCKLCHCRPRYGYGREADGKVPVLLELRVPPGMVLSESILARRQSLLPALNIDLPKDIGFEEDTAFEAVLSKDDIGNSTVVIRGRVPPAQMSALQALTQVRGVRNS